MTPEKLDPALDALIETAVAETRAKMRRELAELDLEHATLDEIEEAVEQVGNELQRNLQRRLVAERTRGPRENRQACPACGGPARYRKAATRVITTRHGELAVSRPYYHCRSCAHGFTPLDAALGLEGSALTTQVRLWIAAVAAHLPFAESADLLGRLTQVRVGASTVERSAVATGTALRRAQQEAAARHRAGFPPPTQRQPTRLYISVDGKYVPLRDPWKKDGSAGELVCRFAECKSAIVYEAKTTPAGDVGVARRAYTATMGMWWRLRRWSPPWRIPADTILRPNWSSWETAQPGFGTWRPPSSPRRWRSSISSTRSNISTPSLTLVSERERWRPKPGWKPATRN